MLFARKEFRALTSGEIIPECLVSIGLSAIPDTCSARAIAVNHPPVPLINLARDQSKIANHVVLPVPIDMVDLQPIRYRSISDAPNYAVAQIVLPPVSNPPVAPLKIRPRLTSGARSSACVYSPPEAGMGSFVVNDCAAIRINHFSSSVDASKCFVECLQFVHLVNPPHGLVAVYSHRSAMAVGAQTYGRKMAALLDVVRLDNPASAAHRAAGFLDSAHMGGFGGGDSRGVFRPHATSPCISIATSTCADLSAFRWLQPRQAMT